MALRDPAAAKGVQVVAHIYDRRVDAEVKRIDWAKTDARATSEKERKNVIISFDWDDGKTTKNEVVEIDRGGSLNRRETASSARRTTSSRCRRRARRRSRSAS